MIRGVVSLAAVQLLFCGLLWANPIPEPKVDIVESISSLLDHPYYMFLPSIYYHFACETSIGQYGLEVRKKSGQIYCQLLNQDGQLQWSEEYSYTHLDEESLEFSAKAFTETDNKNLQGKWKPVDNELHYASSKPGLVHVLLPRSVADSSAFSPDGIGTTGNVRPTSTNNTQEQIVGLVLVGLIALLAVAVGLVALKEQCSHYFCQ